MAMRDLLRIMRSENPRRQPVEIDHKMHPRFYGQPSQ
nr:MAG TPA: hypothetical protein [Caudoviricetes sp.]